MIESLGQKLAAARGGLVEAGISTTEAAVDVDVFARTILGWDRAALVTAYSEPTPDALEPRFSEWLDRRRLTREPTAYIVGLREFWGLDFVVGPAVLIPRPETEFIVEEAIALMRDIAAPRLADVGTGSGCIAVSLAHSLPNAQVVATDVSSDALAVARRNAEQHGVAPRIAFVETNYLDAVEGDFDLIAANPPYVRELDKPGLARAVKHEPEVALFGGRNGLHHLEGVLNTAVRRLRPHGWLVMEFGYGQEDDVRALAALRPELLFDHVKHDLQGLARTAVIQRRG